MFPTRSGSASHYLARFPCFQIDLFQLPPVGDKFFFELRAGWRSSMYHSFRTNFSIYELHEIVRQREPWFAELLNRFRTGDETVRDVALLLQR